LELKPFKKTSVSKEASAVVDVEAGKGGLKGQGSGEKAGEEERDKEVNVPFSRLLMINKPEWPLCE
jgi:hypothetical protein